MTKEDQLENAGNGLARPVSEPLGGTPGATGSSRTEVRQVRFEDLAGGQALVQIELEGTTYVLRRTRSGGLILNK